MIVMKTFYFSFLAAVSMILVNACSADQQNSSKENGQETGPLTQAPGLPKQVFGKMPDGTEIYQYTLSNGNMEVKIINYGGLITSLKVPDRDGNPGDIILGFDNLEAYFKGAHFGPIIGRYSGFIDKGRFSINGFEYELATNAGDRHLHGGNEGFQKKVWEHEEVQVDNKPALQLRYTSPDGEEGYPGTVTATVTFSVSDQNELKIDYHATTDKKTHVNLTQHCYLNLSAGKVDNILGHEFTIFTDKYAVVDDRLICTGELKEVTGTPLDFTKPTAIGDLIGEMPDGYDNNFPVTVPEDGGPVLAASIYEPGSGRTMEMLTTRTGFEFASANWLNGSVTGKGGVSYTSQYGFLLYPQNLPDTPNRPEFPSSLLGPGETYRETTVYRFSVK